MHIETYRYANEMKLLLSRSRTLLSVMNISNRHGLIVLPPIVALQLRHGFAWRWTRPKRSEYNESIYT